MKIQHVFLLALVCLITFSACKKDKEPTASGTVLEYGTNKPIENARVLFYDCTFNAGSSGFGSTDCTLWDSTRTTTNGLFSFNMKDLDSGFPLIKITAENYWDDAEWYVPSTHSSYDEDIVLEPFSWIKLHVKNVNPVNSSDNIRYGGGWGVENAGDNVGDAINITEIYKIRGERNSPLVWKVTKGGIHTISRDTIFCPAHDTTYYEILY